MLLVNICMHLRLISTLPICIVNQMSYFLGAYFNSIVKVDRNDRFQIQTAILARKYDTKCGYFPGEKVL